MYLSTYKYLCTYLSSNHQVSKQIHGVTWLATASASLVKKCVTCAASAPKYLRNKVRKMTAYLR
jgi:hypothetical protein